MEIMCYVVTLALSIPRQDSAVTPFKGLVQIEKAFHSHSLMLDAG